jgi:hypothetical protein
MKPADADLPDLKVRDRAGVPPSSLIWLSEAAGWGGRKSGLRRATLRVSLITLVGLCDASRDRHLWLRGSLLNGRAG